MKELKATAVVLAAAVTLGFGDGGAAESPVHPIAPAREPVGSALPGAGGPGARYSGPMSTDLQSVVDAALKDAARRTGREQSALNVLSTEAVTWRDGSLGCPQPGMNYTMALVPGYRIRIQAGAEVLDYHASRRGNLVLCPSNQSVDPLPADTT